MTSNPSLQKISRQRLIQKSNQIESNLRKSSGSDMHPTLLADLSKQIKLRWEGVQVWFAKNYPFIPGCVIEETLMVLPGSNRVTHYLELKQENGQFEFHGAITPAEAFDSKAVKQVTKLPLDSMLKLADYLPEYKRRYMSLIDSRVSELNRQISIFDGTLLEAGIDLGLDKEGK